MSSQKNQKIFEKGRTRRVMTVLEIYVLLIKFFFFLLIFPGLGDIQKFQGNDTTMDHFKLVLRDGNFLLVGAR